MFSGSFLQSHEWESFQAATGKRTWRIHGVLVIRYSLPGGFSYLYCPRPRSDALTTKMLSKITALAHTHKSVFLRIDRAESIAPSGHPKPVTIIRGVPAPSLQPRKTIALDLNHPEGAMLGAMHEKTRYNIRLSIRKGVSVRSISTDTGTTDMHTLWKLLQATAARDGFRTHTRAYYEVLLNIRSPHFSNDCFFAEYQGKPLAAAIVNIRKPPSGAPAIATYLHGASSDELRNVMAPHALHWHIIREAKARGCAWYDFWGIDEKKWPGVTRFKQGFGGDTIEYAPSVDVVYRPLWYRLYCLRRSAAKRAVRDAN